MVEVFHYKHMVSKNAITQHAYRLIGEVTWSMAQSAKFIMEKFIMSDIDYTQIPIKCNTFIKVIRKVK